MTDETQEFNRLMHEHLDLVERLGAEHPETERAMRRALEYAPPEIQKLMHDKAVELGLMPDKPDGFVDGKPVYRLESIAKRVGMSVDEVKANVDEFMAEREAAGISNEGMLMDASNIQKLH